VSISLIVTGKKLSTIEPERRLRLFNAGEVPVNPSTARFYCPACLFPSRLATIYNANHSYLSHHLVQVDDAHADDPIAQRLRDLGFVQGEPVRLVARGPLGADPLLVQIGSTRFALRRSEAARVSVQVETI
jgi:ferrous iron transport protein A